MYNDSTNTGTLTPEGGNGKSEQEDVPAVDAGPTASDPRADETLVACGFWLPCGRANFFNVHVDDEIPSRLKLSDAADVPDPLAGDENAHRLQVSIYRRLVKVLNHRGYTWQIPVLPEFRLEDLETSEPESVIFLYPDAKDHIEKD